MMDDSYISNYCWKYTEHKPAAVTITSGYHHDINTSQETCFLQLMKHHSDESRTALLRCQTKTLLKPRADQTSLPQSFPTVLFSCRTFTARDFCKSKFYKVKSGEDRSQNFSYYKTTKGVNFN